MQGQVLENCQNRHQPTPQSQQKNRKFHARFQVPPVSAGRESLDVFNRDQTHSVLNQSAGRAGNESANETASPNDPSGEHRAVQRAVADFLEPMMLGV